MTAITTRAGHDGRPIELRTVRDIDGAGKRDIIQEWRPDTLDRLLKNQTIEAHHHRAGRMLQKDWELGETIPCAVASQAGGQARGSVTPSDAKLDAMTRYKRAVASLSPMAKGLILTIIIENWTVDRAAKANTVDHRAYTGALVCAIDQLAQHYGLST